MAKLKFTRQIFFGIAFIYLAGLGWAAEFIIPFTNINHKALIWLLVLVASEISFFTGVAILGKALYQEFKVRLTKFIRTPKPPQN